MYRKIVLDGTYILTETDRIVSLFNRDWGSMVMYYSVERERFYEHHLAHPHVPLKIVNAFKMFALREKIKV